MKKLIPTVALALMGAAAVTGSTYAWFSMNKSVEATGMKVKATTSGALVIGTSLEGLNKTAINFADSTANVLSHSTHDDDATTYPNGLKTLTGNETVDPVTGEVTSASYVSAANPEEGSFAYYVDYECYIASAGEAMTDKLVMSMTDAMKAEVQRNWGYNMSERTKGMADTLFGFTIDVYSKGVVTTETLGTATLSFVNTYHLDDQNATLQLATAIPSSVNSEGTDPVAQGLHYLFRVYLDGEYAKKTAAMDTASGTSDGKTTYFEKTGNNYTPVTVAQGSSVSGKYVVGALSTDTGKYVHTEKANTNELNIGLKFDAVTAAE